MNDILRLCSLSLFAVGPVVALLALLRRTFKPSARLHRVQDWRGYIPTFLLPVEWLLPPG
jgi:hypothetical protein